MSILLFAVGAIAFVTGAVMIAFGIPGSDFSFGNTLIMAGTTSAVGGLVVAALGVAVMYLQRIADALAGRAPVRSNRPANAFEPPAGARPPAAPARVPFPPRPKAELKPSVAMREPASPEPLADLSSGVPFNERAPDDFAPTLPNPDEPPAATEDEISPLPRQPTASAVPSRPMPPPPARFGHDEFEADEAHDAPPVFNGGWRAPPPPSAPAPPPAKSSASSYFDSMWPAEPKGTEPKAAEIEPEKGPPAAEGVPEPAHAHEADEHAQVEEPRAVAILKSGVVDGMGYTLYVDGSIEAELPQGTLRFASINELRSHLEQAS